jgi:hypothetical protein
MRNDGSSKRGDGLSSMCNKSPLAELSCVRFDVDTPEATAFEGLASAVSTEPCTYYSW